MHATRLNQLILACLWVCRESQNLCTSLHQMRPTDSPGPEHSACVFLSYFTMAEDIRESEPSQTNDAPQPEVRRPRRPKPKHDFPQTQAGKLWDAFGNPEEPVNTIPGGTYNSAGGRPKEVTWRDALKFSEFNKEGRPWFYQTSCARDSLLVGMGAGGTIGGLRFILKGGVPYQQLARID